MLWNHPPSRPSGWDDGHHMMRCSHEKTTNQETTACLCECVCVRAHVFTRVEQGGKSFGTLSEMDSQSLRQQQQHWFKVHSAPPFLLSQTTQADTVARDWACVQPPMAHMCQCLMKQCTYSHGEGIDKGTLSAWLQAPSHMSSGRTNRLAGPCRTPALSGLGFEPTAFECGFARGVRDLWFDSHDIGLNPRNLGAGAGRQPTTRAYFQVRHDGATEGRGAAERCNHSLLPGTRAQHAFVQGTSLHY